MRRATLLAAALLGPLCYGYSLAEPVELPASMEISAERITVELRGSQLEVVFDPDATPRLAVSDLVRPSNDEGFFSLEQTDGALQIGQPHGEERVAPRLLVRLILRPGAQVKVSGADLTITVERVRAPADSAAPVELTPSGDRAPPPLIADVRNSTVRLVGVGGDLSGSASRFEIEGGAGALTARLKDGELELKGFSGIVALDGGQSNFRVAGVAGVLKLNLDGGLLSASDGSGEVSGAGVGATIVIDRWNGSIELRGERSRVEVRESGAAGALITLAGARNNLQIEDIVGGFSASLDDGQLTVDQVDGSGRLQIRGRADVSIAGISEVLELNLGSGARAKVREVARLKAELDGARLEAVSIREFDLTAIRSAVVGGGVARRATIRAVDSELDLDFAGMIGRPRFELSGETAARVTLPRPCLVQVDGDLATTTGRLAVGGCELQRAADPRGERPRPGGASPLIASAKLEDAATLSIRPGS